MKEIIAINDVSKVFKLYRRPVDRVLEAFHPLRKRMHRDFFALKNVSVEVRAGECVGLIGMNGSGKSTLLQIIAGVLSPTSGAVSVNGTISALLELGAGFNPSFTGIENVAFQCALMGVPPEQRSHVMNQVFAFAEIGDFVHQPVRTYSSGMFVRLAFATAVHVNPDILIVDEALAVGDMYFQTKCLDKIREFKSSGKTMLFVSHDASAVKALCDRAYLLHKGRILDEGAPSDVFDHYNNLMAIKGESADLPPAESMRARHGTGKVRIKSVQLVRENGRTTETVISGDICTIEIIAEVHQPVNDLTVGISIRDRLGNEVFGINNFCLNKSLKNVTTGSYKFSYRTKLSLGVNLYNVAVSAHPSDTHLIENYDWLNNALIFRVIADPVRKFVGSSYLETSVEIGAL